MHYWGDDWFEKNGDDLYKAIDFIEDYLRKHHIGICGKEKYGCYDNTTDILTGCGWKNIADVTYNDRVATLNSSGYLEYNNPTEVYKYDFDGNMYHLVNRGIDIFVTDNHNLYVAKGSYYKNGVKHEYDYELAKPKKYFGVDKRFKKDVKWEGKPIDSFKIDGYYVNVNVHRKNGTTYTRREYKHPFIVNDIDNFLKFLGFYVAEGFTNKTSICIAHNPKTEKELAISLIEGIGGKIQKNSKGTYQEFCNSTLSRWINENCGHGAPNKKVPEFIKSLSPKQIELFLTYLYIGDGRQGDTSNILTTVSKQLCDDVCELLLKAGYTFSVKVRDRRDRITYLQDGRAIQTKHIVYEVNWLKTGYVEIENSKVRNGKIDNFAEEYVPFKGNVYCVNVPNHIIYARRNGKGYWCGNSYRDEYLSFWDGGLYEILFGYRGYIGTRNQYKYKWLENFINKIHHFIAFHIDENIPHIPDGTPLKEYSKYYNKRIWPGLKAINWKIGLTQLVQSIQAKYYNYAFQLACKKWPNIVDELIAMVDGYKMIKPCKLGDIDGIKIHNKYWKTVN